LKDLSAVLEGKAKEAGQNLEEIIKINAYFYLLSLKGSQQDRVQILKLLTRNKNANYQTKQAGYTNPHTILCAYNLVCYKNIEH
jgi:hypothetical protein